jgi:hypothetical protein
MLRNIICLILTVTMMACSSSIVGDPSKPISLITVKQDGASNPDRPAMTSICKGFYLSSEEVRDFYINASLLKDPADPEKYKILPCYAHGTAAIGGKLYDWTIRAGGIGVFTYKEEKLIKICGIKCCDKVPGIC